MTLGENQGANDGHGTISIASVASAPHSSATPPKRAEFDLPHRQIHLDFHTSEHISGVARSFDADAFVTTLKEAHVDSVTVFALCHHGWSYYPTRVGEAHPYLERPDLLGEMVQACAKYGIETPIYISVQWNERLAREHPEWRVCDATNSAQHIAPDDQSALRQLSPTWHTMCLNQPEYVDHLLDTAREVTREYHPTGLFFDIVVPRDCVCQACLDDMHKAGLDPLNPADRRVHSVDVIERFKTKARAETEAVCAGTRVFFNAGHLHKTKASAYDAYTHFELESLPTAGWGYGHFPFSARYASTLGKPFLGMTGRFHSSWGDFGGFKTSDALIYETSLSSMLGASCSVGDQMHPTGVLDEHAYDIIGQAYSRIETLEPYLKGACQVAEFGVLAAEPFAGRDGMRNNASDDGACRILLETNRNFDVLDSGADFEQYPALIVPDGVEISENLKGKLQRYMESGGSLLLALDPSIASNYQAIEDIFDTKVEGQFSSVPFYIENAEGLPKSPMVVHANASVLQAEKDQWHGSLTASYFNRSYRHFCSHDYAPFDHERSRVAPAALVHGASVLFAFPVFRAFREAGTPQLKSFVHGVINRLLPSPKVRVSGPSNLFSALNWQDEEARFVLHLIYGVPEQRGWSIVNGNFADGAPIELIEDIPVLAELDVSVQLMKAPRRLFDAITGQEIGFSYSHGELTFQIERLHIHAAIVIESH